MLIPNQKVKVKWHPRNKKHLEERGYVYTGIGSEVLVSPEDMLHFSCVKVKVICDYCGKVYEKALRDYWRQRENGKDCCKDCHFKKSAETNMIKYGSSTPFKSLEIRNKIDKVFIEKYGVKRPSQLDWVKEKVKQTNLERFGVERPAQSVEIREKMFKTMSDNNNIPISSMQIKLFNLLDEIYGADKVKNNVPYSGLTMDCLLVLGENKIDIEYDGWYWHKDRQEQDKRRNYFLIRRGFKVLRIRSERDFPSKEEIQEKINELLTSEKKLLYIDLDINRR